MEMILETAAVEAVVITLTGVEEYALAQLLICLFK